MATTSAVMTGKDPAIEHLFIELHLAIFEVMMLVLVDSGSSGSSASNSGVIFSSLFLPAATQEFEKRGFAFFAPELAQASLRVRKVINLSLLLHGEAVLDPLFLHALQQFQYCSSEAI